MAGEVTLAALRGNMHERYPVKVNYGDKKRSENN